MRDSGAKVVNSMLDVQLKIICEFEWKRTMINEKTDPIDSWILPTILLQYNHILGQYKCSKSNKVALHTIPDI